MSDVQSQIEKMQLGVQRLKESVSEEASVIAASVVSKASSVLTGGGGSSVAEERSVRQKLLPKVDDPRVLHYLLLHGRGDLASGALSALLSFLTGGISSSVEKGGAAALSKGLGTALATLATRLSSENEERRTKAHSQADVGELHPDDLIDAIRTLATHFRASSAVSAAKAIPFHIGSGVGVAQSGARLAGSADAAKAACRTIKFYAFLDEPAAFEVIDMLGVPREIAVASGGEKALLARI